MVNYFHSVNEKKLTSLVGKALNLKGQWREENRTTPLLGAVTELDSMTAVQILTDIEHEFEITIYDEEVSGELFETFESLLNFVDEKTSV